MFQLENQQATVASVNVRAEKHGETLVPACDLGVTVNMASDVLLEFADTLRSLLFFRKEIPGDLANQGADFPNLRYPNLGPLKWHYEGMGYTCQISQGIGAVAPIVLDDCKVNSITLAPQEGGTVIVSARIQFCPAAQQYAALCPLVQQTVSLTLTPPNSPEE